MGPDKGPEVRSFLCIYYIVDVSITLYIRDRSLITGKGGGYKMEKFGGPKSLCPLISRQLG